MAELAENRKKADESLRYLAKRFARRTKPEQQQHWCEIVGRKLKWERSWKSIQNIITQRIKTIESVEGLRTLDKVKIVFILSQTVGKKFHDILLKKGHRLSLDERNRIQAFQSKDKSMVLSSDHKKRKNPKPEQDQKASESRAITAQPQPNPSQSAGSIREIGMGIRIEIGDDMQPRVVIPPGVDPKKGMLLVAQVFEGKVPDDAHEERMEDMHIEQAEEEGAVGVVKEEQEEEEEEDPQFPVHRNVKDEEDDEEEVEEKHHYRRTNCNLLDYGNDFDFELEMALERAVKEEPAAHQPEAKPEVFANANPGPSTSNAVPHSEEENVEPPQMLSVRRITEQIDKMAEILAVPDVKVLSERALASLGPEDKTIHLSVFNQAFGGFIYMIRRSGVQVLAEPFFSVHLLLNLFRHTLLRPLGNDLMVEAKGMLDEFEEIYGNSLAQFLPVETVEEQMVSLIRLISGYTL